MNGLHHLHSRMRREPYPALTSWKRSLDYLMYGVGVFQPLALLPQINAIYIDHVKEGVALTTWTILIVLNLLWVLYGSVHRERVIVIASSLGALFDLIIVLGVLYY